MEREKLSPEGAGRRKFIQDALATATVAVAGLGSGSAAEAAPKKALQRPTTTAESAQDSIAARYTKAREYRKSHQTPNGTAIVYFPILNKSTGELRNEIDIGKLNTHTDYAVVEEKGAYRVLSELGFSTVEDFAKAYNEQFSHRSEDDKELLTQNAEVVERSRVSRRDIPIGDKAFIQIRLALELYVVDKGLQTPLDTKTNTISYGQLPFSLEELSRYKIIPQHILLVGSEELASLRQSLDFVKSGEFKEIMKLGAPLRTSKFKEGYTSPDTVPQDIKTLIGPGKLNNATLERLSELILEFSEHAEGDGLVTKVWAAHPELRQVLKAYNNARSAVCEYYGDDASVEGVKESFHCEDYSVGP